MPSDAEQIATVKTQTLALIAQITAAPKPTYDVDGQSVSWSDYLEQLRHTIDWCNEKLAGESPFESRSQAYS